MKNVDTFSHVRGTSAFIDDLPEPHGTLFAAVISSPIAYGKITKLDFSQALLQEGVVSILTAKDIPGENQIGGIIKDEPLFAESEVHCVGMSIGILIAKTKQQAKSALSFVKMEFESKAANFDPRFAAKKGEFVSPSRVFSCGDIASAWKHCDVIVEDTAESGYQEHLYFETQGALAIPDERGQLKISSATQTPTAVQKMSAQVLGLSMNQIEVDVQRLGGGFGGKEDQSMPWAIMAALGAYLLKAPVKLVLSRKEDLRITGKRHPYSYDFKLGLTKSGQILAYQATYYQNSGCSADLSSAVLERSLFHSTGAYFIPNVYITGHACKTNLPSNTAFRGFGAPQAMFVLECAIAKAAEELGIESSEIQRKNLLKEGDAFPYGMKVKNCQALRCFEELEEKFNLHSIIEETLKFNKENKANKKGLAIMPLCFGISFTSTFLNQAGALVHIYTDGSVSVNTGVIEMGQGVNMKIARITAATFGLPIDFIKIESTNTTRVANTSPTAASTGADLNGKAAELACLILLARLKCEAAKKFNVKIENIFIKEAVFYNSENDLKISWKELVTLAYFNRVNLSTNAFYATPNIYLNKESNKGEPFSYHVFGAALVEVSLDCLRGTYKIDKVKVLHDNGKSIDPLIDLGQVEGAIVQGIGWMTLEEMVHSPDGRVLSDTLATYKIPDFHFSPKIETIFLENAENPYAVFGSKGVGEPPFCYGIAAFFALTKAMRAFRSDKKINFTAPLTPERVLDFLYE